MRAASGGTATYWFSCYSSRRFLFIQMTRRSLVLSPQQALVAGGAAEAFEHQVQALYEQGQRHLVV